jgi:hypothetical protein
MKFKEFFVEKRVFALNKTEQKQVDALTSKYVNKMQRMTPEEIKKTTEPLSTSLYGKLNIAPISKTVKPRYDFLGAIKIRDRSSNEKRDVNVFVIFNSQGSDGGVYFDDDNEIYLYHENLKYESPKYIHETITHETIHAVQHYKKMSTAYSRAVTAKRFGPKRKTAYYSEPMEREATIGGLVAQIRETFNEHLTNISNEIKKGKAENVIRYYTIKLETFLKSIEAFATTPPENYLKYKELPLPAPLSHRYEFFEVLSKNPELRREYQLKLVSLSQEMMEQAKKFFKENNLAFKYIEK